MEAFTEASFSRLLESIGKKGEQPNMIKCRFPDEVIDDILATGEWEAEKDQYGIITLTRKKVWTSEAENSTNGSTS